MLKYRLGFFLIGMLLASSLALAAARLYEGKVILASDGKLTVVDKDGDNDEFVVTATTKITRNAKPAKLDDLQAGDRVKIMAQKKDAALVASDIEAHSAE
ncbi:MAG TPA: hypothetical protein VIK18_17330 [Pirellulales bacterium]